MDISSGHGTDRTTEHTSEPDLYGRRGHSHLPALTREPLLTPEEETTLADAAHRGDAAAKNRLVEANMRLVISVAKRYHSTDVAFEDLVQEGAIGLMTAVDRFDPSKGYRFSTYAMHWVRQSISRAIDNKAHAIRVPSHVSDAVRKLEKSRVKMRRELNEEPSLDQVAADAGITTAKAAAYLRAVLEPVSLELLVGHDDAIPLLDLLNDKSTIDPQASLIELETQEELERIMATLSDRERLVMTRRLGLDSDRGQVLQEIGRELRISRERVRQIEASALRRLRAAARRRRLTDYLIA